MSVYSCFHWLGAVLSSKSRADSELKKVGHQKKKVIHALHKCQEKLASVEVSTGDGVIWGGIENRLKQSIVCMKVPVPQIK